MHFKAVFGVSAYAVSVFDKLFALRQGKKTVHEYTLHFRMLTASSGWNDAVLLAAYR